MQDHYGEAEMLLRDVDERHRLAPAERAARAHVHALLAQADAGRAMVETLTRVADALERAHPEPSTGPTAPVSHLAPRHDVPRDESSIGDPGSNSHISAG